MVYRESSTIDQHNIREQLGLDHICKHCGRLPSGTETMCSGCGSPVHSWGFKSSETNIAELNQIAKEHFESGGTCTMKVGEAEYEVTDVQLSVD